MKKVYQIPIWNVISKHSQTKLQKEILKAFFEHGPNTRNKLNQKLNKEKRSKSYNKNLDVLVQLKLLVHEEFHKEFEKIKHPDLDSVEPSLRRLVREAYQKRDWGCPDGIEKKSWLEALSAYQQANYNKRVEGKVGESLYRLTVWGVISHFRSEGKFPPLQVLLTNDEIDPNSYKPKSKITLKDLDLVLPHFIDQYISVFIPRKWEYLCKNNDKQIVYHQLLDALRLANYYYECLNADFANFQLSAIKDVFLHFLMPYTLKQPYADNWVKSVLNDKEMSDFLMSCLAELNEYYKSNQEIIEEYTKILKESEHQGKLGIHKFFKNNHFWIRLPEHFHHGYYYGQGLFGYRLSYFLNELDSGHNNYSQQLRQSHIGYRTKQKGNYMTLSIGPLKNIPLMGMKDEQSSSNS